MRSRYVENFAFWIGDGDGGGASATEPAFDMENWNAGKNNTSHKSSVVLVFAAHRLASFAGQLRDHSRNKLVRGVVLKRNKAAKVSNHALGRSEHEF
jgi:hypothetical protein